MDAQATILLVDDEAFLRKNMRPFLEDLGLQVLEASGGEEALELCRRRLPDLIMLDINMPGMDGYEVCGRLKADPATEGIPVLFLSARLGMADKLKAFAFGAVDYVTKPFYFAEVEVRVCTHLAIRRQGRELLEQHEALRRLEALRDTFTHMVAHDMRGPLSGIIASLELSLEDLPPESAGLRRKLELAQSSAFLLSGMITQMLELSRMESSMMPLNPCPCDVSRLARASVEAIRPSAGRHRLAVTAPDQAMAWCDPAIINRILANLVGNALKFTGEEGSVEVRVSRSGAGVRVEVADDGPGIAEECHASIFEKFHQGTGSTRGSGVGLGLAFCKSAVEAHAGEIGLESRPGMGCTFWFTLPDARPA